MMQLSPLAYVVQHSRSKFKVFLILFHNQLFMINFFSYYFTIVCLTRIVILAEFAEMWELKIGRTERQVIRS